MAELNPKFLEPFVNPENADLHILWGLTELCLIKKPKEHADCFIKGKADFHYKCRARGIGVDECDRLVNNGVYAFCKYVAGFGPCDGKNTYQPRLLPTPAPPPPPPPPPPPTPPPTTTTAAPFPIIPTVGGFAGGALLMAIVLIVSFFIWKKKKKAGGGSNSTSSASPLLQKHPNDSVYLGRGNYS